MLNSRYAICRDTKGWRVYDRGTGLAVIVRGIPQKGVSFETASRVADLLNAALRKIKRD